MFPKTELLQKCLCFCQVNMDYWRKCKDIYLEALLVKFCVISCVCISLAKTSYLCCHWGPNTGPQCDEVLLCRTCAFQTSGCLRPGQCQQLIKVQTVPHISLTALSFKHVRTFFSSLIWHHFLDSGICYQTTNINKQSCHWSLIPLGIVIFKTKVLFTQFCQFYWLCQCYSYI